MNSDMSTSLNLSSKDVPTKRGMSADIAQTFDVLGWIAPSIILMKIATTSATMGGKVGLV